MRVSTVELLFNFAWLAVAISLWGLWLVRRRGARKGTVLPTVAVQLMALAMLTAILLPVISITDDLHCGQLPAEVKRSVLQSDRQLSPAAPPGVLPVALALLALGMNLLFPRGVGFVALERSAQRQTLGHYQHLWTRPPPVAEV
jgi:hypothetical protein